MGKDVISPSRHTQFRDIDSMLDWVEMLAAETGLPVGIKSAVGEMSCWTQLAEAMQSGDRGVDFITIDGGEGGTGAAPLVSPTCARPVWPPQNSWLSHGLDPRLKSVRLATYLQTLRRDLLKVSEAIGVPRHALVDADDIELLFGIRGGRSLRDVYGYQPGWGLLGGDLAREITAIMGAQDQPQEQPAP